MALGLAEYLCRSHDTDKICQAAPRKRIAKQVSGPNHGLPLGALPLEDRRTNTEHYHSQDTTGLFTLAQLCRSIGNHVPDLYTVEVKPEKDDNTAKAIPSSDDEAKNGQRCERVRRWQGGG